MCLGVAVMIGATRLRLGTPTEPQPGFFPFMAAVVLVVLCGILFIQAFLGRSQGAEAFGELWRPALLIAGLFVYSVVLDSLGYVIATMILAAAVIWLIWALIYAV